MDVGSKGGLHGPGNSRLICVDLEESSSLLLGVLGCKLPLILAELVG